MLILPPHDKLPATASGSAAPADEECEACLVPGCDIKPLRLEEYAYLTIYIYLPGTPERIPAVFYGMICMRHASILYKPYHIMLATEEIFWTKDEIEALRVYPPGELVGVPILPWQYTDYVKDTLDLLSRVRESMVTKPLSHEYKVAL